MPTRSALLDGDRDRMRSCSGASSLTVRHGLGRILNIMPGTARSVDAQFILGCAAGIGMAVSSVIGAIVDLIIGLLAI